MWPGIGSDGGSEVAKGSDFIGSSEVHREASEDRQRESESEDDPAAEVKKIKPMLLVQRA